MPRPGALRYLLAPGFFTLRWWDWGPQDGDPVICVHGLTRCGHDFDALAAALAARGRRVLAVDLPGRGESDWLPDGMLYQPPTYVQALSHLLAVLDRPVDWVGTSLGAIIGMLVAAAPGNPIRRLVMNDTGSFIPKPAIARIRDYIGEPIAYADLAGVEAHLRRVHAPFGPMTDADWAAMARASSRAAPEGGLVLHFDPAIAAPVLAAEPAEIDLRPVWAQVRAPVLLLRGAASDLLLADTAAEMATAPQVRLAVIEGCGHAPALMDAAQIGMIGDFLQAA